MMPDSRCHWMHRQHRSQCSKIFSAEDFLWNKLVILSVMTSILDLLETLLRPVSICMSEGGRAIPVRRPFVAGEKALISDPLLRSLSLEDWSFSESRIPESTRCRMLMIAVYLRLTLSSRPPFSVSNEDWRIIWRDHDAN